ncbi:MAG: hypothetical protein BWY49_00594 [Candidatus Omnitrophica bacterium ADurb.Bin314]|nr:MAG: hypothetical protein BWY49_00594 [Candidatus Omnitrophica bacterium ADurb.Bin314]
MIKVHRPLEAYPLNDDIDRSHFRKIDLLEQCRGNPVNVFLAGFDTRQMDKSLLVICVHKFQFDGSGGSLEPENKLTETAEVVRFNLRSSVMVERQSPASPTEYACVVGERAPSAVRRRGGIRIPSINHRDHRIPGQGRQILGGQESIREDFRLVRMFSQPHLEFPCRLRDAMALHDHVDVRDPVEVEPGIVREKFAHRYRVKLLRCSDIRQMDDPLVPGRILKFHLDPPATARQPEAQHKVRHSGQIPGLHRRRPVIIE